MLASISHACLYLCVSVGEDLSHAVLYEFYLHVVVKHWYEHLFLFLPRRTHTLCLENNFWPLVCVTCVFLLKPSHCSLLVLALHLFCAYCDILAATVYSITLWARRAHCYAGCLAISLGGRKACVYMKRKEEH